MTNPVKLDGDSVVFTSEPMTIRDQFALAAMKILLTHFHGFKEEDRIAHAAYYQADCMMKARKE